MIALNAIKQSMPVAKGAAAKGTVREVCLFLPPPSWESPLARAGRMTETGRKRWQESRMEVEVKLGGDGA